MIASRRRAPSSSWGPQKARKLESPRQRDPASGPGGRAQLALAHPHEGAPATPVPSSVVSTADMKSPISSGRRRPSRKRLGSPESTRPMRWTGGSSHSLRIASTRLILQRRKSREITVSQQPRTSHRFSRSAHRAPSRRVPLEAVLACTPCRRPAGFALG